jgi:DHA3 family tetracycline resistance protein-like MFS transporter
VRPLKAYTIYCIYSCAMALLRAMHFTAATIYYVTVVGLNPFQLVLVGTTLMVVILLAEIPTGVLADTYSRRLSVILGVALIGVGFWLEGAVANFTAVLAAQLLWGIGLTFTSGALEAWIADELGGQNVDQVFLRGAQLGNFGALLGIASSVALATVRLSLPLVVSGVALVGLAGFLALFMPEHGFTRPLHERRSPWRAARQTFVSGMGLVRGSTALLLIMGITLFVGVSSESFDRLWEVHFLSQTGFPSLAAMTPVAWFGLINVGARLLSILAAGFARRCFDTASHQGLARLLAVVTTLMLIGTFAFGLANSFTMGLLAYWVVYLLRQLYVPLYYAWLNHHSESRVRATVMSLAGQVDAIGQIAGGPPFGWLATAYSSGLAIMAAACMLLPTLPLYRLALRHEPSLESNGETLAAAGD